MAQARIIVGENNAVRSYAFEMAKGLNCLAETAKPCGECLSCRVFESGNHPDIIFVTGTKASGIGVDDVRQQVILPMATKPFRYKYKIFIVDKAETLTPAAQNALLKTIEEPAPYGFFLFLAPHEHNFLPTVLSRCSLKKLKITAELKADGELMELAREISDTVENLDILETFMLYKKFEKYKDSKETLQEILNLLYKFFGEKISRRLTQGQPPQKAWFNATKAITHTKRVLTQNGNTQLAIELMLVKMREVQIS